MRGSMTRMEERSASAQHLRTILALAGYPIAVALYSSILHQVYSELVAPTFAYLGNRYASPDSSTMVVSWLFASVVALALPRRLNRPSSVMLWILYVVTVAPAILMAPYTSYLTASQASMTGGVIGATFIIVALSQRGERKPLRLNVSPTSLWLVVTLFSCATYVLLMITNGLSFEFVGLLDVYDVRAEYADEASSVGALGYLVATQANVVNPLIAARGFVQRNWSLTVAAVLGQLILYSTTGFKHVLFAILAWFIIVLVLRRRGTASSGVALLIGAGCLVIVAAVIDAIGESNLMTSLFSRRFIFAPGVLTSVYVRFFTDNPQAHLGHSVLRGFVDYPYELSPPYRIGLWMANSPNLAANANLFADGYSNFGWFGIIGAGLVLLVYLRILDRAAVGLPIMVSAMIVVIPAVALSNTSILTAMFSHGLVVAVLLLALLPRDIPVDNLGRARADVGTVNANQTRSARRATRTQTISSTR